MTKLKTDWKFVVVLNQRLLSSEVVTPYLLLLNHNYIMFPRKIQIPKSNKGGKMSKNINILIIRNEELTSWFSPNSTRYSESCSFTNHVRRSLFTFGSSMFTTKHASFNWRWLPGPYWNRYKYLSKGTYICHEIDNSIKIKFNKMKITPCCVTVFL